MSEGSGSTAEPSPTLTSRFAKKMSIRNQLNYVDFIEAISVLIL